MAVRLRIEHGTDSGKTFRLSTPGRYRFGRTPQSSLQILDMKVSKDHFEIWVGNGAAPATAILDLASSHGTWVNAQRVVGPPRPLSPGDEIRIGMTVLRVLSDGPADGEIAAVAPSPSEQEWGGVTTNGNGATAPAPAAGRTAVAAPPRRAQPPDPLVGRTLAGYRILERVGSGGMGAVYKAEQLSLHREVALKVLAERLVTDSAFVDQFVNEARAAGALNHPNVVQVYDVGQADGRHYFSMEYIHGGSLEDRLAKGGAPWEEALPWFQDAANALIFAEKKGILHRDIKPDNLMMSQDGTVKLCDLGLAKKSESADLLAQGIIGTPHFIAPEAIRRRLEVDRRADLYSLGCSFYRILTGKNPFAAASVKEILLAHLNQPPPRASAAAEGVPRELDDVVLRLMQKDPEKRYQTAEDLWEALEKIRLQHGLEQHGLHPGRAKKVALLVASVAVLTIGAAVYLIATNEPIREFVDRPRQDQQPPPQTGPSNEDLEAREAERELARLENETLVKAGRLQDGDSWKSEEWAALPAKLRALAERYPRTEAAQQALAKAKEVEQEIEAKRQDAEAAGALRAKALADLRDATEKATKDVADAVAAGRDHEAEVAIAQATAKVDEVAARKRGSGALLAADDLEASRTALAGLADSVRKASDEAWTRVKNDAEPAAKTGDADGLARAVALWKEYLKRPAPPDDAPGAIAQATATRRGEAESRVRELEETMRTLVARNHLADRRAYVELALALFDSRAGDGLYSGFRFAEVLDLSARAVQKMRTPEYVALVQPHQRAARHLSDLVGRLREAGAKGWEGKVKVPPEDARKPAEEVKVEEVTLDGVVTSDKRFRNYKVLGIPWFLSTAVVGPDGKERVALTADHHEALAVLALAEIVRGNPAARDAALQHLAKAAQLDPAGAERTRRLEELVQREHAAVAEHAAIAAILAAVEREMNPLDPDFDPGPSPAPGDPETAISIEDFDRTGRAKVAEKQAEWTARVREARARFDRMREEHQDSVFVAITSDRAPPLAVYAKEPRPTKELLEAAGAGSPPAPGAAAPPDAPPAARDRAPPEPAKDPPPLPGPGGGPEGAGPPK